MAEKQDASPALERIRAGLEQVRLEREKVLPEAILAVRALEQALANALDGGTLRGLAILAWPSFRGASVLRPPGRGGPRFSAGIDTRLPKGGREVMVLVPSGALHWAWVDVATGEPRSRPVLDRELSLEDLEDVTAAVLQAADRHAERCGRTAAEWRGVAVLAGRLRGALGP